MLLFTILTILSLLSNPSLNANATILFAENALTENGIDWCGEVYPQYEQLGLDWFLENYHYSIEARICGNLYEDPLWEYEGVDRTEKLIERSAFFTQLEVAESFEEAETGVDDPTPADVPEDEVVEEKSDIMEEEVERVTMPDMAEQKNGGCLIATAAFGSELSSQVQLLREVRDNVVLKTQSGSMFIAGFNQFYYLFSPTVADWERENSIFKEVVKITITPLIASLLVLNYVDINSEAEMLAYGISIISLNVGMYFVIPALIAIKLKRR